VELFVDPEVFMRILFLYCQVIMTGSVATICVIIHQGEIGVKDPQDVKLFSVAAKDYSAYDLLYK